MTAQERGTSLHELLIALAVFGVLAAVGTPTLLQRLPDYRLTSAARSLLSQIQRAKVQTIRECTVYYLDFDRNEDGGLVSWNCVLWEDCNGNRHRETLERSELVFDLGEFPGVYLRSYHRELGGPQCGPNNSDVNSGGGDGISFSQNRIRFNPNGTCSAGTIYLHNSTGRTYAIRLRSTGLVQLWRHCGSEWERW